MSETPVAESPTQSPLFGFAPSILVKMKEAAAEDGMTVSGWVRYLVRKELERRGALQ